MHCSLLIMHCSYCSSCTGHIVVYIKPKPKSRSRPIRTLLIYRRTKTAALKFQNANLAMHCLSCTAHALLIIRHALDTSSYISIEEGLSKKLRKSLSIRTIDTYIEETKGRKQFYTRPPQAIDSPTSLIRRLVICCWRSASLAKVSRLEWRTRRTRRW